MDHDDLDRLIAAVESIALSLEKIAGVIDEAREEVVSAREVTHVGPNTGTDAGYGVPPPLTPTPPRVPRQRAQL